jgi:AcrR family transcriptional regulator
MIQAARESFAERGYANASLRDIADRAGITAAGLLHHFRNKEELLAAVLAQRDDEGWSRGVAEVQGPDDLARYFSTTLREHQDAPELMRLWIELAAAASRPDHPAHDYFVDRDHQGLTHLIEGLRERADSSRLRDDIAPESAALLIEALLSGLQAKWLLRQDLDIIGPLNDFMSLLFVPNDR